MASNHKRARLMLLLVAPLAAGPLLTGPAYAEPDLFAGPHAESGLVVQIPGVGAMGTYTYIVDAPGEPDPIAYCVDVAADYRPGAPLMEQLWSQAPRIAEVAPQLNWVLRHSYPNQSLATTAAGSGASYHDGLSAAEAIAATQAALWHYSDGVTLSAAEGTADEQADVMALYSYLTGPANVGAAEDPPGSLTLKTAASTAKSGSRIGPITVSTSAASVELALDGPSQVRLVSADGDPVTQAGDGDEVYVDVPAGTPAGSATVTASASATVTSGRIFAPARTEPESTTQTLVLATTTKKALTAEIEVSWTASPPPTTAPSTPPPATTPPTTSPTPPPTTSSAPSTTSTMPPPTAPPTSPSTTPPATTQPPVTSTTTVTVTPPATTAPSAVPSAAPTPTAPQPELADTGASVGTAAIWAIGLAGGGALALWAGRRTRR